jgi:hypothetical protein
VKPQLSSALLTVTQHHVLRCRLWKYISYLEFSTPLIAKVRSSRHQQHAPADRLRASAEASSLTGLVDLQGYHFMIIVMYIIIAVLGIGFALCIWVGWCFKNDRFPLLWCGGSSHTWGRCC